MASKRKATDVGGSSNGKKKKGSANELGIILSNKSERTRFNKLAHREILPNRYLDPDALNALGIEADVRTLINNIGWNEFVGETHYTYETITREFLSTLSFDQDRDNVTDPKHKVSFSLVNVEFSMSLNEFCDKMGFAGAGLIQCSHNEATKPHNYDQRSFWLQISGQENYESRSAKASMIHNPVFRYVHRIMSCSIFGRAETGTVRADELFLLWAMVNKCAVNTGYYLLSHMASVAGAHKGKIVVGGVISFIAYKLGLLLPDEEAYTANYEIDIDFCKNIHMVRDLGNKVNFQLLIFGKDSIVLPDPSRTDITNVENWLYHDVAPQVTQEQHAQDEPDEHHAQDEPQEQHHQDEEMGVDHEVHQPVGGMEDEADWRRRVEAKIDNQGEMLLAIMQHLNIKSPQPGPE
jgi:hypothetical protein